LLGGWQRDLAVAHGPVERCFDVIIGVRYRAMLDPQVAGVVSASELERNQVVKLAGYVVLAVGGLGDVPFEGFGLRFGRPDRIGVAGPADRRADVRLGDRRVDGAGRAGRIGQQPVIASTARPGNSASDPARVMDSQQCMNGSPAATTSMVNRGFPMMPGMMNGPSLLSNTYSYSSGRARVQSCRATSGGTRTVSLRKSYSVRTFEIRL
jgi:hypothetical protein